MKKFKEYIEDQATPTMATGDAIDLGEPRPLFKKQDRRSRWDPKKLFDKVNGKKRKRTEESK
jgi:hypothetical protein